MGLHFLKETFEERSANPAHKARRSQARAVLERLLLKTDENIRGLAQPIHVLAAEAGLANQPAEFASLLQILDKELKLITPTEAPGEAPSPEGAATDKLYQLTHDFLVPALREWLGQAMTAGEKAGLCLKSRVTQWHKTPGVRSLPTPTEYLRILCLAPRANRRPVEKSLLRAAGRFYTGALAVLAALAVTGFSLWNRAEQARARARVEVLLAAPPEAVPFATDNLRPFRRRAVRLLQAEFDQMTTNSQPKLHAALGLAELGDARLPWVPFLLDSAAWALPSEWVNVMRALAGEQASVVAEIPPRIATADLPEARARLAALALLRGDPAPAQRLTQRDPDPANRTAFIHSYSQLHGDALRLVQFLQPAGMNADFRSALCAALALVEWQALSVSEQAALGKAMRRLHTEAPDGGTHGAAACALTRWGLPLPEASAPSNQPPADRDWFVNSVGMTMNRIPAGSFRMGHPRDGRDATPHTVTLTKPFFVSDREVTVALFRQFTTNAAHNQDIPALERLTDWQGEGSDYSPAPDCPVQNVSWFDAVKFCNWLSRQVRRTPCYSARSATDWQCDLQADGYRLPTEAEWECACRAVSESRFAFGDDVKLLGEYAWYAPNSSERSWPASAKKCEQPVVSVAQGNTGVKAQE